MGRRAGPSGATAGGEATDYSLTGRAPRRKAQMTQQVTSSSRNFSAPCESCFGEMLGRSPRPSSLNTRGLVYAFTANAVTDSQRRTRAYSRMHVKSVSETSVQNIQKKCISPSN